MNIDTKELAQFLVRAKKQTYAGEGKEITSQRPSFKELDYTEGKWNYRDSYVGFFSAPGQEVVRVDGMPVWSMSYNGGMKPEYHGNITFAEKVFDFLKKVLCMVKESMPFRGPENFKDSNFEYINRVEGDITNFKGHEKIIFDGKEVFAQDYIGGLVIQKE